MDFLLNIKQFLQKPFPQEETYLDNLKVITGVSIFVTLFLYVFQPNDIGNAEMGRFTLCLCFGIITFITSIIYEVFIVKVIKFKGENFTFGRWIIYMIGVILLISLANFLFARYQFFGYINWEVFPHMIRGTFMVGVFPIILLGAIALIRQEKKYQKIAFEINRESSNVTESSKKEVLSLFDIPAHQVRYVEALQNYVKIGHFNADGQLVEQTERATLKGILAQTQGSSIVKCHRSYLVNKEAIKSTSGNAQGLILTLENCEKLIPVSRSFVDSFKNN